ncbi:MAG: hypothetical protein K2I23_01875 [Clostridia bacterium]|nr:hypothetical protein [Clostridia bacterium]
MKNMTFWGNENIDYSQYTKKTFGGRKMFLLIMAIVAAVSDFALLVVFAISGHGGLAIPIILLILDGLFIAGICLSNFRFKYAIGIWVAYIVLSVIITSILATLDSGDKYMTDTAKTLNVFSHMALYLVTVFASVYPLLKNSLKLKAIMVAAVAIAVILTGAFAVYFSVGGYFGQGFLGESRVVGYTLDKESDTYIATSIKNGRSNKVVIPEEFDGKKVSGVNCSIFTHTSIKTVEIQSEDKINFVDINLLKDINPDLRIGVDKKYIDEYRKSFLKKPSYSYAASLKEPFLTFSNGLYPINLQDDERYITFAYSELPKQSSIVPTWIGKAGEEFNFDYAKGVDYLQHTNHDSVADLIWCFDNGADKKILTGQMLDVNGKNISESLNNVQVDFESVYAIKIDDDNDIKYEPSDDFKKTTVDGAVYDYRYVTLASANALLEELTAREGFDLSWESRTYSFSNTYSRLTNLREFLLISTEDTAYIRPVWEMKAPTEMAIDFDKNNYVYGDDVKMSVSAKAPNEDCQMHFEWAYTGTGAFTDTSGEEYVITNSLPRYGVFGVYIFVSSDKSSLTSEGYVERELRVDKKPLNFTWQEPSDMVYNNEMKSLDYSVGNGEMINGDVLENFISENNLSNINAGRYTASVTLLGSIDQKYVIASGGSYDYTISPRPAQAQWTCGDFTYDGFSHNAFAIAQDMFGNDLPINLSSSVINAGNYTATATSINKNYVLTNNTYEFVIKQKPVTVTWSNASLTYSGVAQHPNVASVSGLVGYDNINDEFIYSGYSSNIHAGEGYTVKVELPSSSNYKFDSEQSTSYNIGKRALRIRALASNKVYDGKANDFDFEVVSGLASVDSKSSLGTPTYGGNGVGATDAGNYSVTVSLPINIVTRDYEISYTDATFTISKAQVSLTWSDVVVKDGVVTPPKATVSGAAANDINMGSYVYRDRLGRVIDSIPYENGNYSVEVNPTSRNYTFVNTRINFTVIVEAQNREVA